MLKISNRSMSADQKYEPGTYSIAAISLDFDPNTFLIKTPIKVNIRIKKSGIPIILPDNCVPWVSDGKTLSKDITIEPGLYTPAILSGHLSKLAYPVDIMALYDLSPKLYESDRFEELPDKSNGLNGFLPHASSSLLIISNDGTMSAKYVDLKSPKYSESRASALDQLQADYRQYVVDRSVSVDIDINNTGCNSIGLYRPSAATSPLMWLDINGSQILLERFMADTWRAHISTLYQKIRISGHLKVNLYNFDGEEILLDMLNLNIVLSRVSTPA